jgi:hypothetical protein
MPHLHLGSHQTIPSPECFDIQGLLLTFPHEAFHIPFCPIFGKKMRRPVVIKVEKMMLGKGILCYLLICHHEPRFLSSKHQNIQTSMIINSWLKGRGGG